MERKLVTVRKISDIKPIPNADAIELAIVDGWQCVVKKNEFHTGEFIVYFEIDSFLPVVPEFEFLRASSYRKLVNGKEGFRLRTIKLRGQISQGLVVSFDTILKINPNLDLFMLNEEDLAPYLNVEKYEADIPVSLKGDVEGYFPSFIQKTDQERIQNCYEDLRKHLLDDFWECTLKLDGSSMTVFLHEGIFGVCSRNMHLKINDENKKNNAYVRAAEELELEDILRRSDMDGFALQGELMGPGIQGNREGLSKVHFYIFDIYDIKEGKKIRPELVRNYCNRYGLDHVPVVDGHVSLRWKSCAEILDIVNNAKSIKHDIAEGYVYKSVNDPTVSFKAISNRYLLGEE